MGNADVDIGLGSPSVVELHVVGSVNVVFCKVVARVQRAEEPESTERQRGEPITSFELVGTDISNAFNVNFVCVEKSGNPVPTSPTAYNINLLNIAHSHSTFCGRITEDEVISTFITHNNSTSPDIDNL